MIRLNRPRWKRAGLALAGAALAFGGLSRTTWYQDTIGWRLEFFVAESYYALRPPSERAFTPDPTLAAMVELTLTAFAPAATASPTLGPSSTPGPTSTATREPTPIPEFVYLEGARFEYQGLNNCGPANLAMALSYWDWPGDQRPVAAYVKPNRDDKNVMPYELAGFVSDETDLKVVLRVGGNLDLIKRLLAAGFPVLVEKGYDVPQRGWFGHYQIVLGYDDARGRFTGHDSYVGKDQPVPYDRFESQWRQFNFTYLVIHPPDRASEVLALLGPAADETAAIREAARRASDETFLLESREQYFAWFNRGSSLVLLQDFAGAAQAFDEAYSLLATLQLTDLEYPWRILWYQTGPYFAYYYSGRYSDVYSLATSMLDELNPEKPQLEESLYWRGLAREALGDIDGAVADLRLSLAYHPEFGPSLAALARIGASP
jgi:tetratricopeptide (TPR) repeat protein